MAIVSSFSYRGKRGSLKDAVGALIHKKATAAVSNYVKHTRTKLERAAKLWQMWVQLKLSVKYSGGFNKTPWPKRRTGLLRASINRPKVHITKYSGKSKYASHKIKMSGLFGPRPSKDGKYDVSDYLDNWSGKPFSNWKKKSQRILFISMRDSIIGNKSTDTFDNIYRGL